MKSLTESTPRVFGGIQNSVTAAAIVISTSFVSSIPITADRVATSPHISKPTGEFTRTIQRRKQNSNIADRVEYFVAALHLSVLKHGLRWHAPTVSQNEVENSIEISWWRAHKSLIITIEPDSPISFLKVWGPNIHHEMDCGDDPSPAQLIELWQWLYA